MAIYTLDWQDIPPAECRGGALTIGNFDGVHRGHAALLDRTHQEAQRTGRLSLALTFEPHPLQVLRPQQFPPPLTPTDERAALVQTLGIDHVIVLRATPELLHLSAEEFFSRVLVDRFAVGILVEGTNFGFGRNRSGNVATLIELCHQAQVHLEIVPPLTLEGAPVSSSRIRTALLQGAVAEAAHLLGRPYRLTGRVTLGQQRGRLLGFPTANLTDFTTLIPADGVYAVRVPWRGKLCAGAANIGPNPTFGENVRKVEVHLLDFEGDLYDQRLSLDFVERLRDTRPFHGVQELLKQLQNDVERTRILLGSNNPVPQTSKRSEESQ